MHYKKSVHITKDIHGKHSVSVSHGGNIHGCRSVDYGGAISSNFVTQPITQQASTVARNLSNQLSNLSFQRKKNNITFKY